MVLDRIEPTEQAVGEELLFLVRHRDDDDVLRAAISILARRRPADPAVTSSIAERRSQDSSTMIEEAIRDAEDGAPSREDLCRRRVAPAELRACSEPVEYWPKR